MESHVPYGCGPGEPIEAGAPTKITDADLCRKAYVSHHSNNGIYWKNLNFNSPVILRIAAQNAQIVADCLNTLADRIERRG